MADLDRQLRELVDRACNHPPGSAVRQKALTQIIRTIVGGASSKELS
ncbi:hypothetical protein [Chamaesiphon sp. VAR_48_metabat_403]|nr:hypothetical protein [Chamaesiphon sp. VAR_48_metabat_403]